MNLWCKLFGCSGNPIVLPTLDVSEHLSYDYSYTACPRCGRLQVLANEMRYGEGFRSTPVATLNLVSGKRTTITVDERGVSVLVQLTRDPDSNMPVITRTDTGFELIFTGRPT